MQHALRAFTPRDQKAVKTAATTLRQNPQIDTEKAITELAVGEALISLLDEKGRPSMVERAWILAPGSRIGPATAQERRQIMASSVLVDRYRETIDRESAYEKLKQIADARMQEAQAASTNAAQGSGASGCAGGILVGSTGFAAAGAKACWRPQPRALHWSDRSWAARSWWHARRLLGAPQGRSGVSAAREYEAAAVACCLYRTMAADARSIMALPDPFSAPKDGRKCADGNIVAARRLPDAGAQRIVKQHLSERCHDWSATPALGSIDVMRLP